MKLSCPACGASCSWEAWANDAACRKAFAVSVTLPHFIQPLIPSYLALFRQSSRGLSWVKAGRILEELAEIMKAGSLAWDGKEPRVISSEVWYHAFQAVLNRKPEKLTNHNYLRHTAYEMSDPGRKKFLTPAPGSVDLGQAPRSGPLDMRKKPSDAEWKRNIEKASELAKKAGAKPEPTEAERRLDDLARGVLKKPGETSTATENRGETPEDRERKALQVLELRRQKMLKKLEEGNHE